jgi:hypothetical protein
VTEALYGLALRPGQQDAYRRLGDSVRARRQEFAESRLRFGVTRHASWLARSGDDWWALVFLAAADLAAVARLSRESDHHFDVAWRTSVAELWGEQAWDESLRAHVVVDVGHDDGSVDAQFLAALRRVGSEEALPAVEECTSLGLDRLLVTRQDGMLLTYASGDSAGAYERALGAPAEPLLASLYQVPVPEPVIAWTGD